MLIRTRTQRNFSLLPIAAFTVIFMANWERPLTYDHLKSKRTQQVNEQLAQHHSASSMAVCWARLDLRGCLYWLFLYLRSDGRNGPDVGTGHSGHPLQLTVQ